MDKLITDHTKDQVLPQFIGHHWLTLIKSNLPSASSLILRVFPSWLDAFDKEVDHRASL